MHKNATKCNETLSKWCKNKHGASKIMDTLETYQRFYAISGTNLLTRCHSASSLFSAVFVFQKSYTGNILEIGRNKFQKSYFSQKRTEDRTRAGEGPEAAHTMRGHGPGPGRVHLW
jgi:hypothetical protein